MKKTALQDRAAAAAERVIREHGVTAVPVQPVAIATELGIEVVEKPASNGGVSGMLIRVGEQFCIAYAAHIKSHGFRRFSIAHELGHYFLEGHIDAIFTQDSIHESRAGFLSSMEYELEADHFAARLLMPNALFSAALQKAGDGLTAVENLASTCETSLPATAIRYTECTREPVAVILSTGNSIDFCFMSYALRETDGIDWIRKKQPLPLNSVTRKLNGDIERVRRADKILGESPFQDWFGGNLRIAVTEEAIGLGSYGKTLTVLHGIELPEEVDEDEEFLVDSWTPRLRRR
jgi:Zn-dependent peptidase ImmA (M78 family)